MRGMTVEAHRVWRYALFAWVVLVAVPTAYAAIRWQLGIDHDPDMSGSGELIAGFLFILTLPMPARLNPIVTALM